MQKLISKLNKKNIHVIGFTGSEGSGILSLLCRLDIQNITVHDFVEKKDIEKSFRVWHKGLSLKNKSFHLRRFQKTLKKVKIRTKNDYLKDLETADIIFVPQSWRLYPKRNKKLFLLEKKGVSFYTALRLYLEFSQATTIGVTGTVGKGSVSSLIKEILKGQGKKVYFGGNESWNVQVLDKIPDMTKSDYLLLEISHRQIREGLKKAPQILVVTNILPNHLDEVDYDRYVDIKLKLLRMQNKSHIAILNYDDQVLQKIKNISSSVLYYSEKHLDKNTKNVQKIFNKIMNIKSDHFKINILAGLTFADTIDLNIDKALDSIINTKRLPARMQKIIEYQGIGIYNDLKSTTPWATLKAIETLQKNIILILGGDTKNINLKDFAARLESSQVKQTIMLEGQLADKLSCLLSNKKYKIVSTLLQALKISLEKAEKGDKILVSPAAAFFYTKYIKGKKSIRKIITSLLPKEPELKVLE